MEQIVSFVKETTTNYSPWQNTKVYQSHCWCNIQRFLLSLAKENRNFLKLPLHFIANILSTWIWQWDSQIAVNIIYIILTAIWLSHCQIQVLSMLAIKCKGNFRKFLFSLARLNRNLCILHQQWLWYTLVFCQGL